MATSLLRARRRSETMPELPEVESARCLVEAHCIGAKVTKVEFNEDGTVSPAKGKGKKFVLGIKLVRDGKAFTVG